MRIASALLATLVLSACAGAAALEDPNNEGAAIRRMLTLAGAREADPRDLQDVQLRKDTVALPVERAWEEVVRAYVELRIPVTRADEPNRQIGGSTVPLGLIGGQKPSQWLDCGHGMSDVYANEYEVTFSMATRVVPLDPGRSTVESILRASARPRDVSTSPFRCSSLGTLESRVAEVVRQRTSSGAR